MRVIILLAVSMVLLLLSGSAAAGSKAVPPAKAAMNSLPSRAVVQQELDRICSTNKTTYTIQAGDSRMKLMLKFYPDTADWQAMWTLVARCNRLPRITPNNRQLVPGITIALPEFDVPVFLQEDNNNASATAPAACGCTPNVTIDSPASVLDVVTAKFPGLDALVAANMLVACNPEIHKSKGQLAAQQQLAGICPPKNETGSAGLCSCGTYTTQPGDNYRKIMRSMCPNCTEDAASLRLLLSCNVAKGVSKGQLPPGLTLQLPCYQKLQDFQFQQRQAVLAAVDSTAATPSPSDEQTCSGNVSFIGMGPLRLADIPPSCNATWNSGTDGCSAPDDVLRGTMAEMTPCCYTHDFCLSCAFRLGWSRSEGVLRCNDLFLNNMLAFCEALYPANAFMRVFCDVRAQLACNAVRAANYSLVNNEAACPAPFAALAGTDFCFQRQHVS